MEGYMLKKLLFFVGLLVATTAIGMELPPKSPIKASLIDADYENLFKIIDNGESIESNDFLDILFNVSVKKIDMFLWVTNAHKILTGCPLRLKKTTQESHNYEDPKILTLRDLALKSYIRNHNFYLIENGVHATLSQKIGYIKKLEKNELVTCNKDIHLPYDLSATTIPTLLSKYGYKAITEHLQWYCKKFNDYHQYCLGIIDNLPVGTSIKILQILKDSIDRKDIANIHYAIQGKEIDFSKKPYSQLIVLLLKSIVMKQCEIAKQYVLLFSENRQFIGKFLQKIQFYLEHLAFTSDAERKQWMEIPNCMLGILYASRQLNPNQSTDDQIECRKKEIENCCMKITLKEVFGFLHDIHEKFHVTEASPHEMICAIS